MTTLFKCVLSQATKTKPQKNIRTLTSLKNETNCNKDKRNDENEEKQEKTDRKTNKKVINGLLIGGTTLGFIAYEYQKRYNKRIHLATATATLPVLSIIKHNDDDAAVGIFIEGLPTYTSDDVAKHATLEDKIWVSYKRGVYDVTSFVSEHPGGENIMLAAGSSVEPFWLLYAVHKNAQVYEIMSKLRIGNLCEEDAGAAVKDMSDPYNTDPKRHRILKPASLKPFNAEPPAALLVDSFITPNELFYVRNHLPVPEIDPATYELEIECEGRSKTVTLNLADIKKFPKHEIVMTVMCAGNRRSEMSQVKSVKGLDWQNAAVGNATWGGARLADVLNAAGIKDGGDYQHIQFEGLDLDPASRPYGASVPIWKAFDAKCDVILAYEMNGEEIPRDHGYPIRVMVPGVVGARNVKWLGRIILSKNESDSHWQQNDYKGFSPSTDWDTVDFTKSPAIQELPVVSSICRPAPNDKIKVDSNGMITVQGYAWSGGGQKIVRVDVTPNAGDTWHVAEFNHQDTSAPPSHWAWTLWTAKVPVPKNVKEVEIWAKAVDSNYNTQPETFKNIWNLRGVLGNAYHRVRVQLTW